MGIVQQSAFLYITILKIILAKDLVSININNSDDYHKLPRFWTNTGFCPMGIINHISVSEHLLSKDVLTNMEFIGALPNRGLSTVRIHWLLELIDFIQFKRHGIPEYDFSIMDRFLDWINEVGLSIGLEFMGNPGNIFKRNKTLNEFLWEDLTFQIMDRYLRRFGLVKVLQWKLETWNEPDLKTYNLLNFTVEEYLAYIRGVRRGLDAASRRVQNIFIPLRGPAGLFKSQEKHKLCWKSLDVCNRMEKCYFDVITFHRKGQGKSDEVLLGGKRLIGDLHEKFPNLRNIKLSNDEADPIAGWSTPRDFQSDVNYALILTNIILKHWNAMLHEKEFKNLESISHDNAFLSYHPYEFNQRTLFARFQMNETIPVYSQFIQKPVYSALGLIGNLAEFGRDLEIVPALNLTYLVTLSGSDRPFYSAILIASDSIKFKRKPINVKIFNDRTFPPTNISISYIIEAIEKDTTDPVEVWKFYGSPAYPNASLRAEMRSVQNPKILETKINKVSTISINFSLSLRTPWLALVRICSSKISPPFQPKNVRLRFVTDGEILVFWKDVIVPERCHRSYEIWFKPNESTKWVLITKNIHIPFMLYHFQPINGNIFGHYKVRGIDIFGRIGMFSKSVAYTGKG